jgi:hypothetical protein
MSKYLPVTLGIAAILVASTSLAQGRSEREKSSVKAASDCVAAEALKSPNITTLYREDRLDEVTDRIVLHSSVCENPLRAMRLLHDEIYGKGKGQSFLHGAYLADLPNAVRKRIKGEIAQRELKSGRPGDSYGYEPPTPSTNAGQLSKGDRLRVANIGPNDVLTMRKYPTDNSPFIYGIPPKTEEIIFLGEEDREWIFVRYENRAEGWVNRRFVERIVSPGRPL